MTKAEQIAKSMNAAADADFRQVAEAEAKAAEIGVGLYWAGTAAPAPKNPSVEVWQVRKEKWVRRIGEVVRGHDGIWRA